MWLNTPENCYCGGITPGHIRRNRWGSGSSPAKTYSNDPERKPNWATFHPKIADPSVFGDFLRESLRAISLRAVKRLRRADRMLLLPQLAALNSNAL